MSYNIDVFSRLYPVLRDFLYHYVTYKELHSDFEKLPGEKEFWAFSCDAHIKIAAASWCMIFGSDNSNPTHWKNLFLDDERAKFNEFKDFILKNLNISAIQWTKYWRDMVAFRNKFAVHRELEFNNPVPNFELAFKVALLFDVWIRNEIKPDFLDYETFDIIIHDYRMRVRRTIIEIQGSSN